jgi:hypothetical protein
MADSINWTDTAIANLTLKSVYRQMNLDSQLDIPLIIRLFENPSSPIALPGKISLHNHDCLHIILGIGTSPENEAFILGFSMGNDDQTKRWHVCLFKFLAYFIYPSKYRFNRQHLKIFDLGFKYGKSAKFRNLNQIEFDRFYDLTIKELRELFDLDYLDNLYL